uniref:Glycoside hydrolase family 38 central domain-containing protein n=1 Tax=Candidatus Caldatribacterium saccharofermentans TaxID=1454753 RepID=A0A7V4WLK2_9BACT
MYLHFVSHTHWDREWYETFDAFRFRLVRLIDRLLAILEKDPTYRYFLLDGQTIVLEDYLEIQSHHEERLRRLIEDGRIFIGPWYVLTDEFLVSGETHIRNLLFGHRLMQAFGGKHGVGYLPDAFGHIAQMPQILRKSGIPYAIFWRGVPREVTKSEFLWKAPDGSTVLTVYMPFGYGIAARLPQDEESLVRRIRGLIEKLSPFATTEHLLLMNGSDHVEPDEDLGRKLALLRQALPEHEVLHSNLPYFFRKIAEEAKDLSTYEGEWRADDMTYLLGGTLSTRVYLKIRHTFCSYFLERWLEPLYAALVLWGVPYPKTFLAYLWKLLLENSPHDSICGCSIDAVHEEMMQRYRRIETVAWKLVEEARKNIEKFCSGEHEVVLVFNPYPYPVSTYLEGTVYLRKRKIREVDFEISKIRSYEFQEEECFPSLELQSKEEVIVPEILESSWTTLLETPPDTLPEIFRAQRYVIGFWVHDLPPLGWRAFRIVPRESGRKGVLFHQEDRFFLENEFYRLQITPSGSIDLLEKETQKRFTLGPVFEDGADAGDEYDYSPCAHDLILRSDDCPLEISWKRNDRYVQSVRLQYHMSIPRSLTPDRKSRSEERVTLPVTLDVRLVQGSRRVEFDVEVENTAQDHRLRMVFFAPLRPQHHFADAHFALLRRENDGRTYPQNDFVFLEDDGCVFAVFNQGLREYEVRPVEGGTCIAVTLLRAVGWLSRDDLLTRKGDAGWSLPTEGAQCPGRHRFRLAVLFGGGKAVDFSLHREARLFTNPPLVFQVPGTLEHPLDGWTLLHCDNPAIVLSALKVREKGEGLVVRLYNPTDVPQRFRVIFRPVVLEVWRLSLLEEEEERLAVRGNSLEGVLAPYEIATWGVIFAPGGGSYR